MIILKKFLVLFLFILCGCSNKAVLNCSYTDNSSLIGSKEVSDIITFKNNKIFSYNRIIDFNLHSDIKESKSVYKVVVLEGKALKKYIGGKYRISRDIDSVNMSFSSKKINNLKYIGIDSSYGYDEVLNLYNNLGFSCK